MVRSRLIVRAVAVFVALASPAVGLLASTNAPASVSLAATWDGLLHDSSAAAVMTSTESHSVWEDGRIVTYTRVHVDRAIAGELGTGGDTWVRTMGGVVDKVGQVVEGEASFARGESSLLFLRPGPAGSFVVTSRGQGQFPVVMDEAKHPKVVRSHAVGMLLAPRVAVPSPAPRMAADVMSDRSVDDVAKEIAGAWSSAHAR
jgi:hypothetical protein